MTKDKCREAEIEKIRKELIEQSTWYYPEATTSLMEKAAEALKATTPLKDLQEVREALKFYANADTYKQFGREVVAHGVKQTVFDEPVIAEDEGDIARKALTLVDQMMGER